MFSDVLCIYQEEEKYCVSMFNLEKKKKKISKQTNFSRRMCFVNLCLHRVTQLLASILNDTRSFLLKIENRDTYRNRQAK